MSGNAILKGNKEKKMYQKVPDYSPSSLSGLFVYLVFMAGALTVLCETLQSLIDEGHVLLVDVQPQQAETPCSAATDTVQELQSLTHEVVVVLVVLTAKEVLRG